MACNTECGCKPAVIMLVFIPGIMGSRLKNTKTGDSIWDPMAGGGFHESSAMASVKEKRKQELVQMQSLDDDSVFEGLSKWFSRNVDFKVSFAYATEIVPQVARKLWRIPRIKDWVFSGPKGRKKLISNEYKKDAYGRQDDLTSVDEGDEDYFKMYTSVSSQQIAEKTFRGWGSVLWASYGGFLKWLQGCEWDFKADYPGSSFPVYAVGYNWMLSNRVAGDRIKDKIHGFVAEAVSEGADKNNIKIILITHSMGGFAARSAVILSGLKDEIELVIHGAMPTDGAPQLYQEFRAGSTGASKLVLGKNAADTTAVAGFCQGGLELLPNHAYKMKSDSEMKCGKASHEWLYYNNGVGANKLLPVEYGDKIYDFYRHFDRWYSMVQPALLAPEMKAEELTKDKLGKYVLEFNKRIEDCKEYHKALAGDYFSTTIVLYSTSDKSHDCSVWHGGNNLGEQPVESWKTISNENNDWFFGDGTVTLMASDAEIKRARQIKQRQREALVSHQFMPPMTVAVEKYTLGAKLVDGDGTVNAGAGEGLPIDKVRAIAIEATEEHQDFYNCPKVRTLVVDQIKAALPDIHDKITRC
ncbi:hypothetical protein PCNPT3_08355 [Psychromonas sp. CNPT3]|uniref:lipase family alpha/beta hydrolase n=1 Tax=Psychromonas sp. CNPT3 TaxID=314282 RepID=UPI00006E85F9|nr:hypothetical protein [Psychromonas sp. CNPT3]AGH81609.1 hypothetical protein PCNPT3_08355 [Psychromonas sp. CNPT3]